MVKVMITLAIMMTSFEHGAESMAKDMHAPSFNIAFVNPDTEKLPYNSFRRGEVVNKSFRKTVVSKVFGRKLPNQKFSTKNLRKHVKEKFSTKSLRRNVKEKFSTKSLRGNVKEKF